MTTLFLRLIHKSLIGFICRAGLRSTGRSLPPWARPTPSAPSCHPSSSGNPASASRVWPERFARLCPAPQPGVFWSRYLTRYCTTRHTYTLSKVLVASILSHLGTTHPLELGSALQEVLDSSLATTSPTHTATLPFLLHLASLSSGVRRALLTSLAPCLLPALPRLASLLPPWVQAGLFSSPAAVLSLGALLPVQSYQSRPQLLLARQLVEPGA